MASYLGKVLATAFNRLLSREKAVDYLFGDYMLLLDELSLLLQVANQVPKGSQIEDIGGQ